ncbi:MAG: hypothetical protein ACPL6C_04170, partial [bacterium]
GKKIAYKSSLKENYQLFIYDIQTGKSRFIRPPKNLIGQPFFMRNGSIVVNYGGICQIIGQDGKLIKSISDVTSNIIVVTPDDKYLVYTDLDDRLWAYAIDKGEKFQLTPDGERYFSPLPSPVENKVICNKLGGMLTVIDVPSGKAKTIDTGDYFYFTPSGRYIVFTKTTDDGERIISGEIYYTELETIKPIKLELKGGIKLASTYHPLKGLAYVNDNGDLFYAKIRKDENK